MDGKVAAGRTLAATAVFASSCCVPGERRPSGATTVAIEREPVILAIEAVPPDGQRMAAAGRWGSRQLGPTRESWSRLSAGEAHLDLYETRSLSWREFGDVVWVNAQTVRFGHRYGEHPLSNLAITWKDPAGSALPLDNIEWVQDTAIETYGSPSGAYRADLLARQTSAKLRPHVAGRLVGRDAGLTLEMPGEPEQTRGRWSGEEVFEFQSGNGSSLTVEVGAGGS